MFVYLSIGTNIQPEKNAVNIVRELCQHFGPLTLYPFIYTQPVAMTNTSVFLNSLAIITTNAPADEVKQILNAIETKLGRDRNDPEKSYKDRTADIDILNTSEALDQNHFMTCQEPYIAQCLSQEQAAADLSKEGLASHQGAATVHWDGSAGKVLVNQDKLQSLVNR